LFSLKDETLLNRCCEQTAIALEEAINVKSTTSSSSSSVAGFREKLQYDLKEQQSAAALQNVKSETAKSGNHTNSSPHQVCLFGEVTGVKEAFNRFQFCNESSGPQILGILQSDPDKAEATKWKKRTNNYFQSNVMKDPGAAAAGTVLSSGDAATPNAGG
jgi:hypothetical protein